MTEREMFLASFKRPSNYFHLSSAQMWEIDRKLGILDWRGGGLISEEDAERFKAHYRPGDHEAIKHSIGGNNDLRTDNGRGLD